MQLHDLGAVTVGVDEVEQTPKGSRPATLLALLAVNVNRRVPVDTIVDALWGEHVTDGRTSTVESHVWRLRRVLEPRRARGEPAGVLVNDTGGYRLLVDTGDVDSAVFERLADEGRDAIGTGRPDRALRRFDAALALWRGRPFSPCSDEPWAEAAVARLEELHAQVAERRVDALLAVGDVDRALADLGPMISATPFREHLHHQRMAALARRGRTEEALAAYRSARDAWHDELGLEPGADLQTLHRRILDSDPALLGTTPAVADTAAPLPTDDRPLPPSPVTAPAGPPLPVPELPRRLTPIIGRERELQQLGELVGESHLLSIVGPAGCGKTRLAIELTHTLAPRFPDGIWFVDLAQVDDPALAVDLALAAVGVAMPAVGTPLRALGDQVRGRQAMVVLDNCEHLLPGLRPLVETLVGEDADCTVVATSREPTDVDGELTFALSPLAVPDVGGSPDSAAVTMFRTRFRFANPTTLLTEDDLVSVATICRRLDGLPLALELAAARGRSYSVAEIAEQVAHDPVGLRRPTAAGSATDGSLRGEIDRSYRLMTDDEQTLHRALSALPGPFTASAAEAVGGSTIERPTVEVIAMLVNRSLLTSTRPVHPDGDSTFRQLRTVRAHAAQLVGVDAGGAGERRQLLDRRDTWVHAVLGRDFRLRRGEIGRYRTLDDNYASVRATLERGLVDGRDPSGARLAAHLTMYWYTREQTADARRWLESAVTLGPDLDPGDHAAVRAGLSYILTFQGRADLARPHLEAAMSLLPRAAPDDRPFIGDLLAITAAAAMTTEEVELMTGVFAAAKAVAAEVRDPDLDVLCAAVQGLVDISTGHDPQRCLRSATAVHERASAHRHLFAAFLAASSAAYAEMALGRPEAGLTWSDRVIDLSLTYGSTHGASAIETRANLLALAGRPVEAATTYGAARAQARRLGGRWPRRTVTGELLRRARADLPPADFDTAYAAGEHLTLAGLGAVITAS